MCGEYDAGALRVGTILYPSGCLSAGGWWMVLTKYEVIAKPELIEDIACN